MKKAFKNKSRIVKTTFFQYLRTFYLLENFFEAFLILVLRPHNKKKRFLQPLQLINSIATSQ